MFDHGEDNLKVLTNLLVLMQRIGNEYENSYNKKLNLDKVIMFYKKVVELNSKKFGNTNPLLLEEAVESYDDYDDDSNVKIIKK